MTKIMFKD